MNIGWRNYVFYRHYCAFAVIFVKYAVPNTSRVCMRLSLQLEVSIGNFPSFENDRLLTDRFSSRHKIAGIFLFFEFKTDVFYSRHKCKWVEDKEEKNNNEQNVESTRENKFNF